LPGLRLWLLSELRLWPTDLRGLLSELRLLRLPDLLGRLLADRLRWHCRLRRGLHGLARSRARHARRLSGGLHLFWLGLCDQPALSGQFVGEQVDQSLPRNEADDLLALLVRGQDDARVYGLEVRTIDDRLVGADGLHGVFEFYQPGLSGSYQ